MANDQALSDSAHPAVRARAVELTEGRPTTLAKAEAIFDFVQNGIRFGFPPTWDRVRASESLGLGIGYCNTKATLFHALCRAAGVPSRIHTGLIDLAIMRGIFPPFVFPFLPAAGGHAWMEIQIDGDWKSIDTYINDRTFYQGGLRRLHTSGQATAFSISEAGGPSSCEFNFGEAGFLHMGAVREDHGTWDDFSVYMASDRYVPMKRWQLAVYPTLAKLSNRNIREIRESQ
jgi:hypothetical protein